MDNENKLLRCARLTVILTGGILAVLCVAALLLVPKEANMIDHTERTLSRIDELAEAADAALTSASTAAENANQLVADNSDAVSEAMDKFNSVDFDALNRAINDLADIVEPLAKVSNFFSK